MRRLSRVVNRTIIAGLALISIALPALADVYKKFVLHPPSAEECVDTLAADPILGSANEFPVMTV